MLRSPLSFTMKVIQVFIYYEGNSGVHAKKLAVIYYEGNSGVHLL